MRVKASCDNLQLYLAKGAVLHPLCYIDLLEQIHELSIKGLVSPVPITLLDRFYLIKSVRKVV